MDTQDRRSLALALGVVVLGGLWGGRLSSVGAEPPSTDTSVAAPQSSGESDTTSDQDEPEEATPEKDQDMANESEQKATQPAPLSPQTQQQEKPPTTY